MVSRILATVTGIAAALAIGLTGPAAAQQPMLKITYEVPTNANLRPIYDKLKQHQVLEELQAFLVPLRLPRELTVRTAQCGTTNVEYRPQGPVTICYELIDQIERFATKKTRDPNLIEEIDLGGFVQATLHNLAYGIFDVLQVPVWGREDDAADRLAALIMVEFGDDVATMVMNGTKLLFFWTDQKWTGSDFASEVSPDAQRYFNYACIAVAANWPQFGGLVANKTIPPHRAKECNNEYAQIRKAFDLRIMPFIDADLLVLNRAKPWMTWSAAK